jgi:hypothetical protein
MRNNGHNVKILDVKTLDANPNFIESQERQFQNRLQNLALPLFRRRFLRLSLLGIGHLEIEDTSAAIGNADGAADETT